MKRPVFEDTWEGTNRLCQTFTNPYRYGFNGKESDPEIHGSSGTSYDFGSRFYDPRLGRWTSVDPQFKRYPHSSPYVAFGNNALYYVDPGGETLRVAGDEFARKQAQTELQKLTNDKVEVLSDGLVKVTSGNENPGKKLVNGTFLINSLSNHSKTATINFTDGENLTTYDADGNAEIFFNPNKTTGGINTEGSKERPAFIGLGHEGIHALMQFTGIGIEDDENFIFEDPDNKYQEGEGLDFAEYNARLLENAIREEQGLPARVLPSKVIDASGAEGKIINIDNSDKTPLTPDKVKSKKIDAPKGDFKD